MSMKTLIVGLMAGAGVLAGTQAYTDTKMKKVRVVLRVKEGGGAADPNGLRGARLRVRGCTRPSTDPLLTYMTPTQWAVPIPRA
jgi:hypothetical protein